MSPAFESIDHRAISKDVWSLLSKDWMLVTAGSESKWNTMTASWGGFAVIWNLDLAIALVRPSRYTYEFMESSEGFTLSFLKEGIRAALNLCGSKSGRDCDKAREAGLHAKSFAAPGHSPRVAFEEARIVLACKKVYVQDFAEASFLDPSILKQHYPKGDLHRAYFGRIEGAWSSEGLRT